MDFLTIKKEFEQVYKYARKNKLEQMEKFLIENETAFYNEFNKKIKLFSVINGKTLYDHRCYCFLNASHFLKTGSMMGYSYEATEYNEELKNFSIKEILLNGEDEIPIHIVENYKEGDAFRKALKFNFSYIENVLDKIAKENNFQKIYFEDFFKKTFSPVMCRQDVIFLTDGHEGENSHYTITSLANFPHKFKFVYLKNIE